MTRRARVAQAIRSVYWRPARRLVIYIEPVDIWIGVYVSDTHVYVCPLPLLVIRFERRSRCRCTNT